MRDLFGVILVILRTEIGSLYQKPQYFYNLDLNLYGNEDRILPAIFGHVRKQ
jgi:hypothetical protein